MKLESESWFQTHAGRFHRPIGAAHLQIRRLWMDGIAEKGEV